MESIETTGATVEEAVEAGMKELGVDSPAQVMVEVLQEPDQGILGEGAKPARVRLVFMGTRPGDEQSLTSIVSNPSEDVTQIVTKPVNYDDYYDDDDDAEDEDDAFADNEEVALDAAAEDAQVGAQVVAELLDKMQLDGSVTIYKAKSTRPSENMHWILNVVGNDISRLIGHRGETLSSLQYITRLIVSRRLQRRANIIVDVDGYKARRSDRLKGLANRMADQAVQQGRTVKLEPMPPHERRIIHLTLRQRSDVKTKSVGEGKRRQVTINPTNR